MKVLSIKLGSDRRLGPHRIELETEPWRLLQLFGVRPRRLVYEGGIVWRDAATGERTHLEREQWLDEVAGQAIYLAGRGDQPQEGG